MADIPGSPTAPRVEPRGDTVTRPTSATDRAMPEAEGANDEALADAVAAAGEAS